MSQNLHGQAEAYPTFSSPEDLFQQPHLGAATAGIGLRLTTRVPETRWALEKVESLLNQRKIDRLTREEMEDHMFQLIVDGKTPKELLAENARLEAEKLAAEQQKLDAEQQKLAAEQQKLAAENERQTAEARLAEFMDKYAALEREVSELKKS